MMQRQIQLEIFDLGRKMKRELAVDKVAAERNLEPKFPIQLCVKIASVMIIAIVSFTLGIEHGKSMSHSNSFKPFIAEKKDTQKPILTKDNANKESVKENSISLDEYIIQVATYKKDSSYIEKETSRLKQKGYTTLLIPSSNYMQLCAGKFPNKRIATEHLSKLKQTYGNSCYIRKI